MIQEKVFQRIKHQFFSKQKFMNKEPLVVQYFYTSNISKFPYYHLQTIVKKYHRMSTIKNILFKNLTNLDKYQESLLVTLNVKFLYINIRNNEGIKAVNKAYLRHSNKTVLTKAITTFLSLILLLYNFIFKQVNYLQKMGCAMSTVCPPFLKHSYTVNLMLNQNVLAH